MNNRPIDDNDMPAEIDFLKGVAEQRGVDLSDLVTEILRRDIEISEALK